MGISPGKSILHSQEARFGAIRIAQVKGCGGILVTEPTLEITSGCPVEVGTGSHPINPPLYCPLLSLPLHLQDTDLHDPSSPHLPSQMLPCEEAFSPQGFDRERTL